MEGIATNGLTCYISNPQKRFERSTVKAVRQFGRAEFGLVKLYPDHLYQTVAGFGAALTEASGYVYSQMDADTRRRFIDLHFGADGNRYSLCRTVIQSSDFGLGPRMYVADKHDRELESFDMSADMLYELPLIKDAQSANPELQFLASPWSPPSWAKTNKNMLYGGRLQKKYYGSWARIIARYVHDYRVEGVPITRITVQNEPNARQTWESCLFSPEQEREFVVEHLRPALDELGLQDVRILVWDHNKESMLERAEAVLADGGACVDGVAFHWYSGDHFEALRATRELVGPQRDLIFTEGCDSYSAGRWDRELPHAEHYAREIIGDLEAGANGILDWNILLDSDGGPNHVGNYCDAPVMYDIAARHLNVRLPYYYLGHFSRFIRPGARRMLSTRHTVDLETTAFANPDGSRVLVALNRRSWQLSFELVEAGDTRSMRLKHEVTVPAHSIATLVW